MIREGPSYWAKFRLVPGCGLARCVGWSLEAITHRENVAAMAIRQGALRQDVPVKRFVPACLGLSAMLLASGCAGVDLSGLDDTPNAGPCPVAGVLYDANRVVEVKGPERHENVGFTGAIEAVRGLLPLCRHQPDHYGSWRSISRSARA